MGKGEFEIRNDRLNIYLAYTEGVRLWVRISGLDRLNRYSSHALVERVKVKMQSNVP